MSQGKGMMDGLIFESENLPNQEAVKFEGTKFQLFKRVFTGRLGMMVKINLLAILFALPIIITIAFFRILKMADGAYVPFGANIGIGFPVFTNAIEVSKYHNFLFNMQMFLLLIPGIIILCIGLAGTFSVIHQFTTSENTKILKPFFVGIKNHFLPFLIASLFIALSFVLVLFCITAYPQLDLPTAVKILMIITSIIVCFFIFSMAIFFMSQAVAYKFKISALFKNSLLFAIRLFPTNLIILIISAAPIVLVMALMQIELINIVVLMLFVFFGLSFIVCIWTIYSNWAFDMFFEIKIDKTIKKKPRIEEAIGQINTSEKSVKKDTPVEKLTPEKKPIDNNQVVVEKKPIDNNQIPAAQVNKKSSIKFNKKK